MSDVSQWNIVDGSNNSAAPNGWPEGMAPSAVNNSARANMGAIARWFEDGNSSLVSTGSANAYLLAAKSTITALADCPILAFRSNFVNTGAATLKVDSLSAKAIKKNHDQALVAGDIEANQIVVVAYNATDDVFELISGLGNAAVTVVTTRGDIIQGNSSGDEARLAVGTNGQVVTTDGTDVSWGDAASGGLEDAGGNVVGVENKQTTAGNFTVTNGSNLVTGGQFTIAIGHTATVGSGQTWIIV